jgi:hypothetical protein
MVSAFKTVFCQQVARRQDMAYNREVDPKLGSVLRIEHQYYVCVDWAERNWVQDDGEKMKIFVTLDHTSSLLFQTLRILVNYLNVPVVLAVPSSDNKVKAFIS